MTSNDATGLFHRLLPPSDASVPIMRALIQFTGAPNAGKSLLPDLEAGIAARHYRPEVLGLYLLTALREGRPARLEHASPLIWASGFHWLFPYCAPEELREISGRLVRRFPNFKFLDRLHAIVSSVPPLSGPIRFRNDPAATVQLVPSSRPGTRCLLVCHCGMGGGLGVPLAFFDRWLEPLPAHVLYLRSGNTDRYGEGIPGLGVDRHEVISRVRALVEALGVDRVASLGHSGGGLPAILAGCRVGAVRMMALGARLGGAAPEAVSGEVGEALAATPSSTEACFAYAAENVVDAEIADLFAGHPKCRLLPLSGIRDHNFIPHLIQGGGLAGLLSWLVGADDSLPDFRAQAEALPRKAAPPAQTPHVSLFIGYLGPGGAERQIGYLAAEFAAAGWKPNVLAFSLQGEGTHFAEVFRSRGIPLDALDEHPAVTTLSSSLGWGRMARAAVLLHRLPAEIRQDVLRAVQVFRRNQPRLVVCYLDRVNIVGGVAALLAGVPRILLSARNLNPTHFPYLDRPWFPEMYRLLLQSPQVTLMANSQAGAYSYEQWLRLPEGAIPVVRNGLSAEALPDDADRARSIRESLGIADGERLVLGVFRLSPEKRPQVFFDVVERLRADYPDLKAVIAGLGNEFERYRGELCASGRDTFIRLLGRREDVPALLQAADMMLHVSEAEGVPNAIMEAQWMGCPVAGTLGGGTAEILTEAQIPFFHGVEEIDEVVRSGRRLLGDALLRRHVGEASRDEARRRFSAATLLKETLDIARHAPPAIIRKDIPAWFGRGGLRASASMWQSELAAVHFALRSRLTRSFRRRTGRAIVDIFHDEGLCFTAPAPAGVMSDEEGVSPLTLLEDGRPLESGRAPHREIRRMGGGRYSHWGRWLYFSSSDGSDPRTNGRIYTIIDESN